MPRKMEGEGEEEEEIHVDETRGKERIAHGKTRKHLTTS